MRGFERISKEEFSKIRDVLEYEAINLPKRATITSAGYDFYLPYSIRVNAHSSVVIASGIKAFMEADEVLFLVVRSSLGFNGIRLKNQMGVIDSDYYNNEKNEGHIMIAIENTSDKDVELNKGDRIVQGIFVKYLTATNETTPIDIRSGGIGSTRK